MSLTSRKKRPLNRTIPHLRDTKLIVIATEGQKTEKRYFDIFTNLRIQVKILSSEDNRSAPEYVFERLNKYRDEYQIAEDDELWLMIDIDRWGSKNLMEVFRLCSQKDYQLAVSNPCFEIWLLLHLSDIEEIENCKEAKRLLREILGGYNSSNLNIEAFRPYVNDAVERAKRLHKNLGELFPSSTGSHVYKIIEKLF